MEKENGKKMNIALFVIDFMGIIWMILNMAKASFSGKVVMFIKVPMKMIKDMGMESLHG